ncbi:MAG: protein-L-isoaspartate O-methyltransferase [Hyphomicrobiaceae bacterium]|nr:protein-L-isoaspartate O-methyltransferase [Hyphomicrobiaceae bacterium]
MAHAREAAGEVIVDVALQRKNMVESQVRPSDVTDRRIPRAMGDIAREAFVPTHLRAIAYMDEDLTLVRAAPGRPARGLMSPRAFARLVQLAAIEPTDVVLDVGCATGYSSAVIARLAETVVALESDPELAEIATRTLRDAGADNVVVVAGDLALGYAAEGPYDAIVVEGAIEDVGESLLDQLKDAGRLVAIKSAGPVSRATLWRRLGATFDEREVFEASAPVLPGFALPRTFVF